MDVRRQQVRYQHTKRKNDVKRYMWRRVKPGFWEDPAKRLQYMDFVKTQLGGTLESMYQITTQIMHETGGPALLTTLRLSPAEIVMHTYPEHGWCPWKFKRLGAGWWSDLARSFARGNIEASVCLREYIEDTGRTLGVKTPTDWIDVPTKSLPIGFQLHLRYFGGLRAALQYLYPYLKWPWTSQQVNPPKPIERHTVMRGQWQTPQTEYNFMLFLKDQLGGTYEDLYNASFAHCLQSGGKAAVSKYNNSAALAVMTNFPDHCWSPWKFNKTPKTLWQLITDNFKNGDPAAECIFVDFISTIEEEYDVQTLDDWYSVPLSSIDRNMWNYVSQLGGLVGILARLYPTHSWQSWRYDPNRKKLTSQKQIFATFNELT